MKQSGNSYEPHFFHSNIESPSPEVQYIILLPEELFIKCNHLQCTFNKAHLATSYWSSLCGGASGSSRDQDFIAFKFTLFTCLLALRYLFVFSCLAINQIIVNTYVYWDNSNEYLLWYNWYTLRLKWIKISMNPYLFVLFWNSFQRLVLRLHTWLLAKSASVLYNQWWIHSAEQEPCVSLLVSAYKMISPTYHQIAPHSLPGKMLIKYGS